MPDELHIPAGSHILAPLGDDGLLAGVWDGWQLLQQDEINLFSPLENLPPNLLLYPYVSPVIIIPSGVGSPTPIVQTPRGTVIPTPPPRHTFPRIVMTAGNPGADVPRDPWTPLVVGDAVCNNWLLYQSNLDGDWDVYRLGQNGATRNVSQGPGSSDVQASYSADGQWIAWVSNRDGLSNWEIWVAAADGSQPRRATFNTAADTNPVWGPGGQIVFESNRDGNWELYLLDVTGDGLPVRLTDSPGSDINAYWTPDGKAVYFQSDRDGNWQIYRLELASGDLTRITNNDLEDQDPVVSHDGTLLAWIQMDDFGFSNLLLMTLATQDVRQMTDTGSDVDGVVFSPDDDFLAFYTYMNGNYDVFAVEIASGTIENVTHNPAEDLAPAFLCGSSTIIFQSDRNAGPDFPGLSELFETNPLPFGAPIGAVNVLTNGPLSDQIFPNGFDREERNTRAWQIPAHGR